MNLLGDYRYPESNDNLVSEDCDIGLYVFAHGMDIRTWEGNRYQCSRRNSEFDKNGSDNERRVQLWMDCMERAKGFMWSSDPRVFSFWKQILKTGPWTTESTEIKKQYRFTRKNELVRRGLWLDI
jgi:hypothetical protein